MNYCCTLLLIFFIYAVIGWIIEVTLTLFQEKKFINRGFLIGPIVPIYGVGVVLIHILLNKYSNDPVVLLVMSMFVCGTLEYITSYLMEKIFKNRWWDYSQMKFNLNGRICLEYCVLFGLGGVLSTYLINPYLIPALFYLPTKLLIIVTSILSIILIVDICISFNIIIKLKNISSNINTDSTEVLTKKVRDILISKTYPYRRLLQSFPDMKIFNKLTILTDKLKQTRKLIREEKKKNKKELFKLLKRKK